MNQVSQELKQLYSNTQKSNRLFLRNNQLFISVKNTNNLKQNLNEFKVRENHTNNLYWFTLKPRATFSPRIPLGNPLSNQTRLKNTNHQSSDLEPFKKYTTFGKPHQEY